MNPKKCEDPWLDSASLRGAPEWRPCQKAIAPVRPLLGGTSRASSGTLPRTADPPYFRDWITAWRAIRTTLVLNRHHARQAGCADDAKDIQVEIILSGPIRRNLVVSSTALMNCLFVWQQKLLGLVAVPTVRPVASTLDEKPHPTARRGPL